MESMKNNGLPMSDADIKKEYAKAKDQQKQIGILADLNGCTRARIREIVGVEADARKKREQFTDDEMAKIDEMCRSGYTVYRIAAEIGRTYYSVRNIVDALKKSPVEKESEVPVKAAPERQAAALPDSAGQIGLMRDLIDAYLAKMAEAEAIRDEIIALREQMRQLIMLADDICGRTEEGIL